VQVFITKSGDNYLAAIAGVGEIGKDTVHFDEIEVAQIRGDGSIGEWKTCPFHLKGGRSAPGSTVVNGSLYVFGGWGDLLLEDVFSDVQYAPIRDDGCLDPWFTNETRLNMPLYGHTSALTFVTGSSSIIVLGGNAGQGNYFNNVQVASVGVGGGAAPDAPTVDRAVTIASAAESFVEPDKPKTISLTGRGGEGWSPFCDRCAGRPGRRSQGAAAGN
jgi:hypothetical protein